MKNSSSAEQAQGPAQWSLQSLLTVVFLGLTAGVQMSDYGLQAISLSAIQKTFAISDAAVGALQGLAGVLVGSALAIPLARFADRFSRKRVLLCLVLASTAMMVLSALAPNFPLFFLGRSAAGITEFAMVPLVYSMIPDLAPERHRVFANLGFAALVSTGASAGFYYAGDIQAAAMAWIPGALDPWRKAFLLLSAAGLPLLVAGLFTADPPRHAVQGEIANGGTGADSLQQFLRQHWRPIALFVGVAGSLMIAVQGLNQLMALALERRFNATPAHIGKVLGALVLVATLGCLPVVGWLDRWLGKRLQAAVRPLLMGICALLAVPAILMLYSTASLEQAFVVVGVFLFVTCTANALVPTMLQDLAPPPLRARCFALWSFVVSVFSALGPLLAGFVSTWLVHGRMLSAIAITAVPTLLISAYCAWRLFLHTRSATQSAALAPAAPAV
ncbi:MFS family permease [Comamonas odontotermitis]|uniref:MFS family permease n=1 Tax=Comamonas odontotermitis TaxID=379895 RepID=A0ABR6RIX4_9BURK|nr:MFS transporter [Comamonas odontotermitis]MBB6579125.1 MFS family permease [Comamonas odontotermitis]